MTEVLYTLEYVSPLNDRITLSPWHIEGPYLLMSVGGLSASSAEPITRKGVAQPGATLVGTRVGSKIINCSIAVLSADKAEYWSRRETLVNALNMQVQTTNPKQGTLIIHRSGHPSLQIPVTPQLSPIEVGRPDNLSVLMDIEFFAPSPHFQAIDLSSVTLKGSGGFEFPLEHPWESGANRADQGVMNQGTVNSPITATLYGEFTNGRLINSTTGETLEYVGTVAVDERVVITTAYGNKRVTHIDAAGVETNAMGNLNLTDSSFWSLVRDLNELTFEADSNPSGYAVVTWRPRYGGV